MTAIGAALIVLSSCSSGPTESAGSPDPADSAASQPATREPASPADVSGDLAARWWQWAAQFEQERSPISDRTGEDCRRDQPDDVFFLAGSFGEKVRRTCRVDAGKPVFLPAVNTICWGERDASACAFSGVETHVTLDGTSIEARERASDGAFRVNVPAGSPLGVDAGTHRAVAWGLWSGPLTLSPGRHELRVVAQAEDFSLDVVYDLEVG